MTVWLKQSTAVTIKLGPFIDDTDGKSAETGLTITQAEVRLSKNGGNIAQKNESTSLTHDELGHYDCPLDATDTNTLGVLRVMVHESGALPVWQDFMVVPANVYDSLILGSASDYLQVDVIQWKSATANAMSADYTATEKAAIDLLDDVAGGLADIHTDVGTAITNIATIDGIVDTITGHITADYTATEKAAIDLLDDAAGGLADIHTDVGAVKTDTAAIKLKTDNLPADPADDSDIDTQLATIAGYLDTEVAAILAAVDTEVGAIKAKTDNLPASPAAVGSQMDLVNAPNATAVTAIQSGLATAAALTAVDDFVDTEVGAIKAVTDKIDTAVELDGAVYRFTTNALELAPVTAAAPTVTQIRQEMDANSTQLTAIKAKTDNLPTDPADDSDIDTQLATIAGYLDTEVAAILAAVDTEVGAIKAKTDNLPASPAAVGSQMDLVNAPNATAVTAIQSGLATAANLATVDTVVDAIKLKTDNLPTDPADDSDIDTQLATIAGYLDTEVAAILAAVDTEIGALPTASAIADAVWDEALSGHTTAGTAGKTLSNASTLGAGAYTVTITVHDSGGVDIEGASVWITTDAGGANIVASGTSNGTGTVTLYLDAGSYYLWTQLGGYNFTNPATLVVTTEGATATVTSSTPIGLGTGSTASTITVHDTEAGDISGAYVWVTSDVGGATIIATGTTGVDGTVTFNLDPGTYYAWVRHASYTFTNPTAITVS